MESSEITRIETDKLNIINSIKKMKESNFQIIIWYDIDGIKNKIKSKISSSSKHFFKCEMFDKEKELRVEANRKYYLYCEALGVSFKLGVDKEKKTFEIPVKMIAPENRRAGRHKFDENDINIVNVKNTIGDTDRYNLCDISASGMSIQVGEADLKLFQLGTDVMVSSLPFCNEQQGNRAVIVNKELIYKKTYNRGNIYRIGMKFVGKLPSILLPETSTRVENIDQNILSKEVPFNFYEKVDKRIKEKLFESILNTNQVIKIQNLTSAILSYNVKDIAFILNQRKAIKCYMTLYTCPPKFLENILSHLNTENRMYLYENTLKDLNINEVIDELSEFNLYLKTNQFNLMSAA